VWVGDAKVAAVGVRVSRWVTSHGFALNLDERVRGGFDRIVPCGIDDARVTTLEELLGAEPDRARIEELVSAAFSRRFAPAVPG
jgi:lipoyl(octanoyl) transferase